MPERSAARELRLVAADSYAGWEEVYRDNVGWIFGLMYEKTGNRPDAEDLTAEVFSSALPPLRLSAGRPEVRGYLRATARTVLAAHWRRRLGREITCIPDDLAEAAPEPAPGTRAAERAAALLAALPDRYRRILDLRFLQGMSVREAAEVLGISVTNAKVLQHRALRAAARVEAGGGS
nr:RNA polymerase sigma factor [Nocardia inohanensis]